MHDDPQPAASLLRCLDLLAEEAGELELPQTVAALRAALETCRIETEHHAATLH